jgi:histidine ammonia-lyase
MGCTSGLKLHQILDNVEQIVGIEYLAAAQGVDFRLKRMGTDKRQGIGTAAAYALIRQSVPFIERDTLMYPHLETGRRLVAGGALTRAVDAACEDCWSMTP